MATATARFSVTTGDGALDGYFYFHGVRGAMLEQLGRHAAAREAFGRAIALANPPAEAAHIRERLDRLEENLGAGKKSGGNVGIG